MAGETIKAEAVCLDIRPWSRTSHVVRWLTPSGPVVTVVKGAVRPKSFFLGQYDLNYTCEILYYARANGEVHALREAIASDRRDFLRDDYRALALAGYFRSLASELAPSGPESAGWFRFLSDALTALREPGSGLLGEMLAYELGVLEMTGLRPEIASEGGSLLLRGERRIPVSAEVAACLRDPRHEKKLQVLLDAARVIGVFYHFHLGSPSEVRRTVLGMISNNKEIK